MASDSITFASDRVAENFGRDTTPPAQPEKTSAPVMGAKEPAAAPQAGSSKPSKLRSAGNAAADLIMGIGVFITGGIFALGGYRRVTALRLTVEAVIVAVIVGALYYSAKTWLYPYTDGVDFGDPLQRAMLFVLSAIVFAYLGGMVVHIGWNRKGDPKISMIVLALGMTLIGLRIASVGMAYGEVRVADARVAAAEAGVDALSSTIGLMKAEGVDPKPAARIIMDFQKKVYGSKYIEGFYSKIGVPDDKIAATGDEAPAEPANAAIPGSVSTGAVEADGASGTGVVVEQEKATSPATGEGSAQ